jgi:hypothetical protein
MGMFAPIETEAALPCIGVNNERRTIDFKSAAKAQRAYEEAIRSRCSPIPLFDIVGVPKDSRIVVAVNV